MRLEEEELVNILRERTQRSSQKEVASELRLSETYISDILKGKRGISQEVAFRMGYRQVKMYQKR